MSACFECGAEAEHQHHVVPRSLGGTQTVWLCEACHGKVHDQDLRISTLTRMGMQRLQASGQVYCRPVFADAHTLGLMHEWRANGWSYQAIADELTVTGVRTVRGGAWAAATILGILRQHPHPPPEVMDPLPRLAALVPRLPAGDDQPMDPRILRTPENVAARLGWITHQVLHVLRTKRLRGFKSGKQWRIRESDLQDFIEANIRNGERPADVNPPTPHPVLVPSDRQEDRKAAIVPRIQAMHAQGISHQKIANTLNAEGEPNLSGRGSRKWSSGTVGKLLAEVEA